MLIYDISDPTSPTLMNSGGTSTSTNAPIGPYVQGRYAYILSTSSSPSLQIFDISNPTSTAAAVGSVALTLAPTAYLAQK